MDKIRNYNDLKVWQVGIKVVKEVYSIANELPKDELYGLSSQMKRAAISIPANIAEGFKRYHNKEYKQFLRIALGSAAELETLLVIVRELKIAENINFCGILDKLDHISRMLSSLMNKIK